VQFLNDLGASRFFSAFNPPFNAVQRDSNAAVTGFALHWFVLFQRRPCILILPAFLDDVSSAQWDQVSSRTTEDVLSGRDIPVQICHSGTWAGSRYNTRLVLLTGTVLSAGTRKDDLVLVLAQMRTYLPNTERMSHIAEYFAFSVSNVHRCSIPFNSGASESCMYPGDAESCGRTNAICLTRLARKWIGLHMDARIRLTWVDRETCLWIVYFLLDRIRGGIKRH
jgi:hypothetical protein